MLAQKRKCMRTRGCSFTIKQNFEITIRKSSLLRVWIREQSKQQGDLLLVGRTFIILSEASTCVYSQIYNLPFVIDDDGILRIMTEFSLSQFWQ